MFDTKWLTCFEPKPNAQIRLFCFPYAGGSASIFHPWVDKLPSSVELIAVQPPGRADRVAEPKCTSMNEMVDGVWHHIARLTDKPYVMFGHSMGALVAYEVLAKLSQHCYPMPRQAFLSASKSPSDKKRFEPISHHNDAEFINELRKLNGTPKEVLENKALMDFCLPFIRADFRLVENYWPEILKKLNIPVWLLGGENDMISTNELAEWQHCFDLEVQLKQYAGDHFYLHSEENSNNLVNLICASTLAALDSLR